MTYDLTVEARGTFSDELVRERCVEQVLAGHAGPLTRLRRATPRGKRRRMAPLRWLFEEAIGTVCGRDGGSAPARIASVIPEARDDTVHVVLAHPELPLPPAPAMPAAELLFGSYLHEQWQEEHEHPLDAVRQLRDTLSADTRAATARELAVLLARGSELTRRTVVRGLGSAFVPRPDGQLDQFLAEAIWTLQP